MPRTRPNPTGTMQPNSIQDQFSQFYTTWLVQLEHHLNHLTALPPNPTEPHLNALVASVTQHYKDYFSLKWALAVQDVLPFYYPMWTTPLENAFSWVTGWKPSAVFRLLRPADLSPEQHRKIDLLKGKIRAEQAKVEMEMERQQMGLADRKMVELARLVFRVKSGDEATRFQGLVQAALGGVLLGLVKVMKAADCVRLRAMKGTLDILNPLQSVDFLALISMFLVQLTKSGKKLDCIRHL